MTTRPDPTRWNCDPREGTEGERALVAGLALVLVGASACYAVPLAAPEESESSESSSGFATSTGEESDATDEGVCEACEGDGETTAAGSDDAEPPAITCGDSLEGDTRPCGSDVGQCTIGTQTCVGGEWTDCTGHAPQPESCDLGELDEDCDGVANEGCACPPGQSEPCPLPGACGSGLRTCSDDALWGDCSVQPSAEVCDADGVDENCDGSVNEGCDCALGDTTTDNCIQLGACAGSQQTCGTDGTWGSCSSVPGVEVCGGGDEDCDGSVDEGSIGPVWYADLDQDGHHDPDVWVQQCSPPAGYIALSDSDGEDCEDHNEWVQVQCNHPPLVFLASHGCPIVNPHITYHDCPDHYDLESSTTTLLSGGGSYETDSYSYSATRLNGYVRVTQTCNFLEATLLQTELNCVAHQY